MFYQIVNGSVSYGADTVLEEINFEIREKEKIAIVGRNGCGKTTLLRVLTNQITLSEGTGEGKLAVTKSGNPVVGYLEQIAFTDNTVRMIDEIKKVYQTLLDLEQKISQTAEKLHTDSSKETVAAYSDMMDRFEFLGGYSYKKEYETAIKKFGFTEEDKQKPLSDFSGGQRTKIALIKLLLSKPDILLLDEPTNHLDVQTVEWLEEYLKNYKKSMVIVSHDRMFLDKTVNVVYEIEYGVTTRYPGNFTDFTRRKRENYEKQLKDHEAQRKEIERLNRIVERFKYKPTKASMAFSKMKQIEHMQIIDAPNKYDLKTFHADFQPKEESVKTVLQATKLAVGYQPEQPLATLDFELFRGQKLAIIGANGTGKSTLLKTLTGKLSPLSGSYAYGLRVQPGYFDQQMAQITSNKTLLDYFWDEFPGLSQTEARKALGAFQFTGDDVFKTVDNLSGGEKVRLALCRIFKRRPNLLILDEPTNHMDIVGKETLENILAAYEGTLIFVSHDRYFVNKLADRLIVFEENGATFLPYGYTEYEEKKKSAVQPQPTASEKKTEKQLKKSFTTPLKEKGKKERRIAKLEKDIAAWEEETAALTKELEKPEIFSDHIRVAEIQQTIEKNEALLTAAMDEWETLSTELEEFGKPEQQKRAGLIHENN